MAQITFTLSAEDMTRVVNALGNGSASEAKAYLIAQIKRVVKSYEYDQAVNAIVTPSDPNIT